MPYVDLVQRFQSQLQEKLLKLTHLVERDVSFPKADHKILIAIGMRRTGKTYLLYQTIQKLLAKKIPLSRILYINFEDDRLLPLTREKCAGMIEAFYALHPENHDHRCYLFLDEIQNVPDWPIIIRRFFDTKNVQIYLTGSSAKLLSKEIATSLRGRSLAIEVFPYSFSEYLRAKEIKFSENLFGDKEKDQQLDILKKYIMTGGFPEVIHEDTDLRIKTLQDYIDVVIYRDIVERYSVKHLAILKYMIVFMLSNPGRTLTVHKFYNDLKSQGHQLSKSVLYEYAEYIEDAYLAFLVNIHDRSIRRVQTNPKKIYAIDPGMLNAVKMNTENDFGWLFENMIFLDLKRQGYLIEYYLTKERLEIDFLAQTGRGEKKLIQVCWNADDLKTKNREEKALSIAEVELKIKGQLITPEYYLQHYLQRGCRFV